MHLNQHALPLRIALACHSSWSCSPPLRITLCSPSSPCSPGVAHRVPQNYICLLLYTASMSWLLSAAAAFVDSMAVAWAIGGTIIVVLALTALAWQTRIQFSACSGVLLVLLVALIVLGLSVAAMPSRTMQLVYGTAGVIVFGIFLLVDTSLIVSGSRGTDEDGYGMALETDDYILAALLLYSDVSAASFTSKQWCRLPQLLNAACFYAEW